MISSVSAANVTNDNSPIEYEELQPKDIDIDFVVFGTYIKYPMQDFGDEKEFIKEYQTSEPIQSDDNDTRKYSAFKSTIVTTIDGNATIKIIGNENTTGQIYLSFLKTPLNLTDGQVEYNLTGLERGYYEFKYYYSGDENYKNLTQTLYLPLPSTITSITNEMNNFTMYYKDGNKFKATLKDRWGNPLSHKGVNFNINGVVYTKETDENGTASINLNLDPGIYDIITHYVGSTLTAGNLTHTKVKILPTIIGSDIKKLYKNATQYYVKVTDNNGTPLVNQTVQFNINGVFYNHTSNEEGFAKLNINLDAGNYIITSENLNDNCKISNKITVLPTTISNDLIKIYKNASQFNVKLLKTDGSPLANSYATFNINGVFYNRSTDNEGNARLNINLLPGKYIITTENHYDNSKKSNTIVVTPYLYTNDLTKYYKSTSRFVAKLVDSNYNPQANKEITFMINSVEYTRNTDNNGEASIAINLQPGNYEIITKNSEYQVANRIIVLSTLIDQYVDNVTINSDENEKYNVMILDGNGNPYPNQPVTFKYANQIEKVMTDENGIAGFEAKRINEYRPIGIEYNGYEIIKCMQYGVQFKKYPYVPADRTENEYIPIKLIDIINPNAY